MRPQNYIWALCGGGFAITVLVLGCSSVRLSGYGSKSETAVQKSPAGNALEVDVSTRAARQRVEDYNLPAPSTSTAELSLYYSDLGPDSIDVSSYPARQRHNYALYRMACSQCHTLARSINAPMVNRHFWELYILGMRFNAHFSRDKKLEKDDIQNILDFLEYDSNVRKREHRPEFEALEQELKRRYQPILEERIRRLQQGPQPIILRDEQP